MHLFVLMKGLWEGKKLHSGLNHMLDDADFLWLIKGTLTTQIMFLSTERQNKLEKANKNQQLKKSL